MFELGEHLLDGVEVGAIGGQEQKFRSLGSNGGPDGGFLVAGKVVQHHDVAWLESWTKLLLDPGGEAGGVDRLVEDERGIDAVISKCCDEGHGFPVTVGHLGLAPLANRRPAAQGRHIGFCPGFINENQTRRINLPLVFPPQFPAACDLWPQLFGGQNAFF